MLGDPLKFIPVKYLNIFDFRKEIKYDHDTNVPDNMSFTAILVTRNLTLPGNPS